MLKKKIQKNNIHTQRQTNKKNGPCLQCPHTSMKKMEKGFLTTVTSLFSEKTKGKEILASINLDFSKHTKK